MEFLFKETVWASVTVPEDREEEILELIKNGQINTANDIFQYVDDADYTLIDETSRQMSIEDNKGDSTIEVVEFDFVNDRLDKKMLWENVQPEEEEDSDV